MMAGGASCAPSRWSLPAKATVAAQQLLILVHALDEGGQEQQELGVLAGGLAGLEEVLAGIGGQRPVVVLAGAVDAREGLFVQQAHQVVALGHLLHHLHGQLVLVAGGVGVGIDGGHLVLGRGPPRCAWSWRARPASRAPRPGPSYRPRPGGGWRRSSGRPAPGPWGGLAPKSVRPHRRRSSRLQIVRPGRSGSTPAPRPPGA